MVRLSKEKQIEDVYNLYKTYKQQYDELVAVIQKTRMYHLETEGSYSSIIMQDEVKNYGKWWRCLHDPNHSRKRNYKIIKIFTIIGLIKMNLYKECIDRWGLDAQIDMCIEEMSEVMKALLKHRRAVKYGQMKGKPISYFVDHILEELADTTLMINQMLSYYDHDGKFNQYYDQKVARIMEKLQ